VLVHHRTGRSHRPGVAIEGRFEPPPLRATPSEDQTFVAAFVRCHGSIKQMEQFFGVSYPTIKNRLNRIGAQLPFAEIDPNRARTSTGRIERAALAARVRHADVDEVLRQLRKPEDKK